MADKYGGLVLPVPLQPNSGAFPPEAGVGDLATGYLANFLTTIVKYYAGDAWSSVAPQTPIIKTSIANDPTDGFNEATLPALYVYRPGHETREAVESFTQVADDYRFQKSRIEARWILNAMPQANQRVRNQMFDAVRKVIDQAIQIGRDKNWIVPGDTDPKAAAFGSSLCNYAGFASIELEHAAPSVFAQKMMLPAPQRHYDELKMSFIVEELLNRDITLYDPNNQVRLTEKSPDQGTGLGDAVIDDGIYE